MRRKGRHKVTLQRPSEEEVLGYFDSCSNWGRWGPEDELGTINFINSDTRKRAAALVKDGHSVTCSRPIIRGQGPDVTEPAIHFMGSSGERWAGVKSTGENQSSRDFIGLVFHGYSVTHLDALSHIFWDGLMYNGFPANLVTSHEGATKQNVDLLQNGIVTRGVLLDIPRLKNVDWLEPGTAIYPDDLEEAEKESNVRVESGDVLFIRTGWYKRRLSVGSEDWISTGRPGLQAAAAPWLHKREIALLGGDTANDMSPTGYKIPSMPIHQIGIVKMGLWLIDNANLEALALACKEHDRWEFMLTIAPLRISNGTGSPINPIATF